MLRIKKYHFDCHNPSHAPFLTPINSDHTIYQDTDKKLEWTCVVYAEPSIFHPETDMEVIASASNEVAKQSQKKGLKPGDRVVLTGIMRSDRLSFPMGESKTMYQLTLTQAPQMVVKEKQLSTTMYEQRRKPR